MLHSKPPIASSIQKSSNEPTIIVDSDEEDKVEKERIKREESYTCESEDSDSGLVGNPYLLCPWSKDLRKSSLPTPQCSEITASQVRRLSERGDGATSPGPKQTEFLATLISTPTPTRGGRRHSVVTISKVPSVILGRNRRESVSVFPNLPGRILPSRKNSTTGPPSTEPRGSVHNLQLDIMDDIVQARKVRMKLWNTSSEKVCEVQQLDEAAGGGSVQTYTSAAARRNSDFVGTALAPIPSLGGGSRRRASALPCTSLATVPSAAATSRPSPGPMWEDEDSP